MVYRFKLVSDEVSNFSREIEIDSENTFLQLRNAILESVGFTKDELDSFFLCNDDWEREEEVTLEDMGVSASDCDQWLMESTALYELIEDEGQKLSFVFDYLTERSFFLELKEMIPSRSLVEPICTMKRGKAPAQFVDMNEFEKNIEVATSSSPLDDIVDIDTIDSREFNDDELNEGFDIIDDM